MADTYQHQCHTGVNSHSAQLKTGDLLGVEREKQGQEGAKKPQKQTELEWNNMQVHLPHGFHQALLESSAFA